MRHHLVDTLRSDGTRARALRSSAMVVIGFGGSNVLRLASNLILARLLFPEAFGLMSLVYVFLTGLQMFSDIGLNVSIIQNKRGEEPAFLNTAWSLQIIRGVILWLGACALAYPVALTYGEPQLAHLLPVVGLTALIQGFTTTRIALANRRLQIGIQVLTDLCSQMSTLIVTSLVAWLTGSVWSLVAGALFGTTLNVISQHLLLKGPVNRLHLDREIVWEILQYGKYLFLGSVAGFLINQSDRAILGGYISLTSLGVFTVGFMFANVPLELARAAGGQIVFPLFSKFPPSHSAEHRKNVLKARRLVLLSTMCMGGVLSLVSVPMVDFLYDSRYHDAGPILALLGFSVTAQVAASNYDGAYLGAGDSRQHFRLIAIQALIQVVVSFLLIARFGILGAIFAVGISVLIAYPFRAHIVHRYCAWDPKTDLIALGIGWGCAAMAAYIWQERIMSLSNGLR